MKKIYIKYIVMKLKNRQVVSNVFNYVFTIIRSPILLLYSFFSKMLLNTDVSS